MPRPTGAPAPVGPAVSPPPTPSAASYSSATPPTGAPGPVANAATSPAASTLHVRIRGIITEIGAERFESVSLNGAAMSKQFSQGCLMAPFRALGIVLGLLFAPLRMLLIPSVRGGGSRTEQPNRLEIPATPFVLTEVGGVHHDCILRGELRGGFLKLGEDVIVTGRIDRARVLRVDRVESQITGAVTTGWVDPRARLSTARTVAGIVLVVMLVFLLLFLGGAFSR
ncbi:hypothetical protein [Cryobacterium aureum]|uniref:hypothetical protein n=1 Tax=Cryobacterium aureum TaxID=995037 RepID=UPI00101AD04E|nr:hypothetical protein [Cryobacterium aureum]